MNVLADQIIENIKRKCNFVLDCSRYNLPITEYNHRNIDDNAIYNVYDIVVKETKTNLEF